MNLSSNISSLEPLGAICLDQLFDMAAISLYTSRHLCRYYRAHLSDISPLLRVILGRKLSVLMHFVIYRVSMPRTRSGPFYV
ncbi:hypothetical protein LINGRAHAP2_LOCUS31923, partial [Linum grandiflorum]